VPEPDGTPVMKHLLVVLGALQPRPLGTAHVHPPEPEAGEPDTTNPPSVEVKSAPTSTALPPGVIDTVLSTVAGAAAGLVTDEPVVVFAST